MSEDKTIIAWVTKYALTQGIMKIEAVQLASTPSMIVRINSGGYSEFYHRLDWHHDERSAICRANEMRDKKIKSLEKQIARLKKLRFEGEKE